jgi:hypothetical protein
MCENQVPRDDFCFFFFLSKHSKADSFLCFFSFSSERSSIRQSGAGGGGFEA